MISNENLFSTFQIWLYQLWLPWEYYQRFAWWEWLTCLARIQARPPPTLLFQKAATNKSVVLELNVQTITTIKIELDGIISLVFDYFTSYLLLPFLSSLEKFLNDWVGIFQWGIRTPAMSRTKWAQIQLNLSECSLYCYNINPLYFTHLKYLTWTNRNKTVQRKV